MCSPEVEVYTAAGCRLYKAGSNGSGWEYTGVFGAATVLSQGESYYIRLFDLDVRLLPP